MLNKGDVLQVLKNTEFKCVGRAGYIVWMCFGDDILFRDDMGTERVVPKYSLHIQCSFRITLNNIILITDSDMYRPCSTMKEDEFNCDIIGHTRYDEFAEKFSKQNAENWYRVVDVSMSKCGDVKIILTNGCIIEIFVNCSDDYEAWRFFENSDENESVHYVMTGDGCEV